MTERLALIGVSQRRGGTQALVEWTAKVQTLTSWPEGVKEIVPLLTCNRCDLILAVKKDVDLETIRQRLAPEGWPGYAFADEAALEQLCRVAVSLDSVNPGEDQIMQQVRAAFDKARVEGQSGPLTGFAFQTALRIAKRVRRDIPLAPTNTSLFSLVRPEFERCLPEEAIVAVIGIGKMGALAARNISMCEKIKLIVVNRSVHKAQTLAYELGAEAMSLADFLAQPPLLHGVITATPIEYLLTPSFLQTQHALRVIADLGLPRNVAPSSVPASVVLFDLEKMQVLGEVRRQKIKQAIVQAEAMVQEELEEAFSEWCERRIGASITLLRQYYYKTFEPLGLDQLELKRLVNRVAHFPIKGLRGLARRQGLQSVEIFFEEAGLDALVESDYV